MPNSATLPLPAPRRRRSWAVRLAVFGLAAIVLAAGLGFVVWWKFFSSAPQQFADERARFHYGSLGGELVAGIPYPIFMILPRVFPDLVERYATEGYGPEKPGYGGYGAFGLAWEEGERLPVGLSIKRLGQERVSLNCALCHTASYRLSPDAPPQFAVGGPAHTLNLQGLLRFLIAASHDRRFTAARLMPEIALHFPLDALDYATYSLVLIPKTRAALRLAEHELGWMERKPAWGPGRDDAFNLPKFILTQTPWDDAVGNTDFPALWRLRNRAGGLLHSAGEAKSLYAVVATSAIGIGSLPTANSSRATNGSNRSSPSSNRRRFREGSMPSWREAANRFSPGAAPAAMPRTVPAPAPRSRSPKSEPIPSTCWRGGNQTPIA